MGGEQFHYPTFGGISTQPYRVSIFGLRAQLENRAVKCPYCDHEKTRVIDTSHDARGGTRRRRVCDHCGQRFSSYERPILATPLLVKRDGTREEFTREKLLAGIRVACVKRPVAAADIERIAGEVEAELQQMGRAEVPSRLVGDRIISKLKELDEVAYIRYAIVYLGLDDLDSIRKEIDRLLGE
jgi:transcriptional repressor NrdR